MIQEEKQLLTYDLCARLPYGVFVQDRNGKHILTPGNTEFVDLFSGKCNIKSYLRPMSSMTEEEKKELKDICTMDNSNPCSSYEFFGIEIFHISRYGTHFESDYTAIDWLNAHHFDYRGLIEKGLALEAPEDMYKLYNLVT